MSKLLWDDELFPRWLCSADDDDDDGGGGGGGKSDDGKSDDGRGVDGKSDGGPADGKGDAGPADGGKGVDGGPADGGKSVDAGPADGGKAPDGASPDGGGKAPDGAVTGDGTADGVNQGPTGVGGEAPSAGDVQASIGGDTSPGEISTAAGAGPSQAGLGGGVAGPSEEISGQSPVAAALGDGFGLTTPAFGGDINPLSGFSGQATTIPGAFDTGAPPMSPGQMSDIAFGPQTAPALATQSGLTTNGMPGWASGIGNFNTPSGPMNVTGVGPAQPTGNAAQMGFSGPVEDALANAPSYPAPYAAPGDPMVGTPAMPSANQVVSNAAAQGEFSPVSTAPQTATAPTATTPGAMISGPSVQTESITPSNTGTPTSAPQDTGQPIASPQAPSSPNDLTSQPSVTAALNNAPADGASTGPADGGALGATGGPAATPASLVAPIPPADGIPPAGPVFAPPPPTESGGPNFNPEAGLFGEPGLPGGPATSFAGEVVGPIQPAGANFSGNFNADQGMWDVLNNAVDTQPPAGNFNPNQGIT